MMAAINILQLLERRILTMTANKKLQRMPKS